ncbi:cell division protein FtsQ [Devosia pacifica]|uniref:Cell division protein FtsQ n=1 Tax=Devosia pacifica TaxID=1335967 RepID=A0A918VR86_9HYPH|nr:cell division protein FtsQ/DivIB [Devosia pacifica]GHA15858.1 cell division protein FtsQ [Devosia pacifica]
MQQVGTKAFLADAHPVDPRLLPVLARRPGERVRIRATRAWILHRHHIVRALLVAVALVLIASAYQFRHDIGLAAGSVGELAHTELARAGFGIERIQISGQTLTQETDVLSALAVGPGISMLSYDVAGARERIAELPAVDGVTIRKDYPNGLEVELVEKLPVARWRVDGVTFVVDGKGNQIGVDKGAYGELPLVIGDGAADDAIVMIRALQRYPDLTEDVVALSRIADRRWDLLYETGLRVQLPELGVAQALDRLEGYQRDYQLIDRDVTIIDLRVPHLVALRPAKHEEEDEE